MVSPVLLDDSVDAARTLRGYRIPTIEEDTGKLFYYGVGRVPEDGGYFERLFEFFYFFASFSKSMVLQAARVSLH